jgi:hypothetical protein
MSELAVAIGDYLHHGRLDVDEEVAQVVELFTEFGGHEMPWAAGIRDRGGDAVVERLLALCSELSDSQQAEVASRHHPARSPKRRSR